MDDDDDLFIGEPDEDPLALSSCEDDDFEDDDEESDGEGRHHKPVALAMGRRLLDIVTEALVAFDAIAPSVRPHQLLSVAAPPQSGTYQVAGLARLRAKLAAEQRHIADSVAAESTAVLRGNNVTALNISVAVLCSAADVAAAAHRIAVPETIDYVVPEGDGSSGDRRRRFVLAADERAARNALSAATRAAAREAVVGPLTTARRSVEMDFIIDGGRKWVKVKASSPSNFLREAVGVLNASDPNCPAPGELPAIGLAPFLDTLRTLLVAASSPAYRLPFGQSPAIIIACAAEPPPLVRQVVFDLEPTIEFHVWSHLSTSGSSAFLRRRKELRTADGRKRIFVTERKLFSSAVPSTPTEERAAEATAAAAAAIGGEGPAFDPVYPEVRAINFDVTALVAMCCDCCHGFAGHRFPRHHILDQQSSDEAAGQRAVDNFIWPALLRFTIWEEPQLDMSAAKEAAELIDAADGEVVVCPVPLRNPRMRPTNWFVAKRALDEFKWILETISGKHEMVRAGWLLARLRVVDDADPKYQCVDVGSLTTTNKIQDRHRAVFGVGNALRALTLTGNRTFVQAAQEQGLSLYVFFHPSRALTERKRRGIETPVDMRMRKGSTGGPPRPDS